MKILILGSEGFIGSNAVKYFRQKKYQVWTADIVVKQEPFYSVVHPDQPDFDALFSNSGFDICLNASGAANVQVSFQTPAIDFALNTLNVYRLLDTIRRLNPSCRFINLSSAAVYGNPIELPICEESPLKPLSPYGWHKLYSEEIGREFFELFGVPTISLRVFSAYGEGLKKQLFWDLYKKIQAAGNGRIELFGTGNETRDFIYIYDIMQAIDCVIKNALFNGTAVNIASGTETKIADAVTSFGHSLKCSSKIEFTGQIKIGDPSKWRADIGLLKSYGFKPAFNLNEGINNYVQWLSEKVF